MTTRQEREDNKNQVILMAVAAAMIGGAAVWFAM
jgi:hypothetical protein